MRVVGIAAGLHEHMNRITTSVNEKAGAFMTESTMPMICTSVHYMGDLIKLMVNNKKRSVFSEQTVMQDVFKELKEGHLYQE